MGSKICPFKKNDKMLKGGTCGLIKCLSPHIPPQSKMEGLPYSEKIKKSKMVGKQSENGNG